jgi:branched-chain amino acid transport system permease protein
LIGPNGSGKTTLLNCVTGLLSSDSGSVEMDGRSLLGKSAHEIAATGIGRTFQTPQCAPTMTAIDNALLGWHRRQKSGLLRIALQTAEARRESSMYRAEARRLCESLGLAEVLDTRVSELTLGERRIVELARALGGQPKVLLMDEPAAGLTLSERQDLAYTLRSLKARGLTIVVIDHDMEFIFSIADEVTVLDRGANIAAGKPAEVRSEPAVIRAYFGAT